MKRKLNEHDVPEEMTEAANEAGNFTSFRLDARLLQGIAKENYATPTAIQVAAIPPALKGRNILARAKTGSGKTAAYLLPLLQSILKRKASVKTRTTTALILVPTRELANQVTKSIATLSVYCSKDIQAVNLTSQIPDQAQNALLAAKPDIVVATPARAAQHFSSSSLSPDGLTYLVIDEADLVLSYGYEEDLDSIVGMLPTQVQTFLASATLSTEVDTLKATFCRDPVVIDLHEEEKDTNAVNQYVVETAEEEKFLLLFALFKLKLIKGKCIIFVADVDRCYRLKLYLEQFGIKSCVLNSELPVNSRVHVVEEFNKNVYDIIIASDEHEAVGPSDKATSRKHQKSAPTASPNSDPAPHASSDKPTSDKSTGDKSSKPAKDKEYGIARGIDFHRVTCILNFDLPPSPRSYTHRIGRTARAGRAGLALSFAVPAAHHRRHPPLSTPSPDPHESTPHLDRAGQ